MKYVVLAEMLALKSIWFKFDTLVNTVGSSFSPKKDSTPTFRAGYF